MVFLGLLRFHFLHLAPLQLQFELGLGEFGLFGLDVVLDLLYRVLFELKLRNLRPQPRGHLLAPCGAVIPQVFLYLLQKLIVNRILVQV